MMIATFDFLLDIIELEVRSLKDRYHIFNHRPDKTCRHWHIVIGVPTPSNTPMGDFTVKDKCQKYIYVICAKLRKMLYKLSG